MTAVEIVDGVVTDVLERDEIDQYVVPEAALYALHEGEELAIVDPHHDHWSRRIPDSVGFLFDAIVGLLPTSLRPVSIPTVIAPAGTFAIGDTVQIRVEPVVDPDVPKASGETLVYRLGDRERGDPA